MASIGRVEALAALIPMLGRAPLEFQPGARWAYSPNTGFDTLLRIVEIVSGETADRFLSDRVFQALEMKDTAFWTPATRNMRLVPPYSPMPRGVSPVQSGDISHAPWPGAGGSISTAEDYLQFGQMLLNSGELNGVRLLLRARSTLCDRPS
jgi:CubicO group peptidase (beta-lactamase class C family)